MPEAPINGYKIARSPFNPLPQITAKFNVMKWYSEVFNLSFFFECLRIDDDVSDVVIDEWHCRFFKYSWDLNDFRIFGESRFLNVRYFYLSISVSDTFDNIF